ncbi:hypothetical protein NM688_g4291 [Phlebia brevispora]|uniref:Uncharacterized protein n=1 Tax=Phlebia brevispora TaxID=194682 RepID=A0ACC1T327_9APHY|nr:hypothetical protein NM688_g4291 [Phlebia brevispora]
MNVDSEIDGRTPGVTEILLKISNQLQDISARLPPVIEQQEPWEEVRDTVKQQDNERIDLWQDELNALLIFAGLLSTVVTAFVIVSFTWLQQNPEDTSNTLLAHISLQLTALASTSMSANDPIPALPLQNVISSFTPIEIAVPVNVLWVLSLALSLISAFFTIAVQQWLRNLRLPMNGVPVRLAVKLWELRNNNLQQWQVPSIITWLSAMLQIAVVLFLIGIFVVLRSMNATITTAFGVVAAFALFAYLVSAIIPLISIRCPYKSPLVPILVAIFTFKWLVYLFALLLFSISSFVIRVKSLDGHHASRHANVLSMHKHFKHYMKACAQRINISQFWLLREYEALTKGHRGSPLLAQKALWNVFHAIPSKNFPRFMRCLSSSIKRHTLEEMFARIFMHSMGAIMHRLSSYDFFDRNGRLHSKMEADMRHWGALRLSYLGWSALQKGSGTFDGHISKEDNMALTLFHALNKASPVAPKETYLPYLLKVCSNQRPSMRLLGDSEEAQVIPACLMFDSLQAGSDYKWKKDEAEKLVEFAHRCLNQVSWQSERNVVRLCLAADTSALDAMVYHKDVAEKEAQTLLKSLIDLLQESRRFNELKTLLQEHPEASDKTAKSFAVQPMLAHLCHAVVQLTAFGVIHPDKSHSLVTFARKIPTFFPKESDRQHLHDCLDHLELVVFGRRLETEPTWADVYPPLGRFALPTASSGVEEETCDQAGVYPFLFKDPLLVTLALIKPREPEPPLRYSSYWAPEADEDEDGAQISATASKALSETIARVKDVTTGIGSLIDSVADARGARNDPTSLAGSIPEPSEGNSDKNKEPILPLYSEPELSFNTEDVEIVPRHDGSESIV